MFLGTHTPKIDEKGRFFLPARFREELADGLVITRGQDRSLAIYPRATFIEKVQAMQAAPSTVERVRAYQRMVAAAASDEVPDRQGRVGIPPTLRSYAGLEKDIVVVGALDRVEVWDAVAWQTYSAQQEETFAAMNEEVWGL